MSLLNSSDELFHPVQGLLQGIHMWVLPLARVESFHAGAGRTPVPVPR